MKEYVQSYAEVISQITGIDIEIMDKEMVRIAGTGIYAKGIGNSLTNAGEIYKEVLRTHETVLVESPRSHKICEYCPDRNNCAELLSLATPIMEDGQLLGVIGLVCFTEEDRKRVLSSLDNYRAFIAFLADVLASKVGVKNRLNQTVHLLELMLQAVDIPWQGVVAFDHNGELFFSNQGAQDALNLSSGAPFPYSNIRHSGNSLYGMEEFEIYPAGSALDDKKSTPLTALGRVVDMYHSTEGTVTLFTFELTTRFAMLAGEVTSSVSGTGFDTLIGNSKAIIKLKEHALQIADSQSTVLITGESGTGKELLARAIHQASSRRDNPFIAINCGGIPDTLLESELFGYVSGAFTGASNQGRMGKFELAQGGVVFLDELSTMPLYLQVKLLRVLQERSIVRLGSNRIVPVDVRIIGASNENLEECIARNTFRDDLYYRLNVIPLIIPPLRERSDDIITLAHYFLDKYAALFGKRKIRMRSAVVNFLKNYSWPGNVRELEHVIEYAVNLISGSRSLGFECLPERLVESVMEKNIPLSSGSKKNSTQLPSKIITSASIEPLAVIEERAIRNALDYFGNTTTGKKQAAKALGLSLATLYRKTSSFSD